MSFIPYLFWRMKSTAYISLVLLNLFLLHNKKKEKQDKTRRHKKKTGGQWEKENHSRIFMDKREIGRGLLLILNICL